MFINWFFFAFIAYLCLAISQLIDKVFLNIVFKESRAYVAMVGLLGLISIVLAPLGVEITASLVLSAALLSGALFVLALIPFLKALQMEEASKVIPLIGAIIPIGSLIGESLFLGSVLNKSTLLGFVCLVVGSILLTHIKSKKRKTNIAAIYLAIIGAILFATSFVISKYVYSQTSFVSAFFWMRVGGGAVGIVLLYFRSVRGELYRFFTKQTFMNQMGYFANQALSALGIIFQSLAISMASVSLVNALQGIQYVLVIILIIIFSQFGKSHLIQEHVEKKVIIEKILDISLIAIGIALVAL